MRIDIPLLAALSLATTAQAQPLGGDQPLLKDLAAQVSADRQKAVIEKLVSFGTRHTGSDTKSDKRGIGAARRWIASEFEAASKDCGGRLKVATPSKVMTAERLAGPTEVMDILGILPGTTDPNRVIVISGHYDSRVTDAKNFTSDAPGANDDGSGTAAVIEAAKVLCKHQYPATLVFAALAGEEQGLLGGKVLAEYAVAQGWNVEANLNNDIVGNTEGIGGARDNTHVRIFSEGTRTTETAEEANRRRYNGGEVDSPSRNLARFMDGMADRYLSNFDVVMVYRTDRFSRGGDQVEMLKAGFPAVRVTEAVENYTRQHQDLRTEKGIKFGDTVEGVDFAYLAQVTRLNVVTMAALAMAPAPPTGVQIAGAVSADTTVKWTPASDAAGYRVWWRGTTEPQWRYSRVAGTTGGETKLTGVNIDDWFFGVSALSADGYESPVVFPGPAGTFERGGVAAASK
ncbi:MAG: M20/M25/M40 family metallo-hydrolase [Alphaproteobacteria bacterium]|nr:M20/M25/M40 family metallo-hydrolase [Alphaproteobacteria bacterium]MBU1517245.1 M20/M25/M40 family metallo-hydrolase [Alphaproteobacteria bacterium]MBU2093219.1 M20/M25/M40 family metallo-hydrolase [Alphaproteobacteria bacterium]MBU2153155.1 M20/M25/M40 family metallo-hydrolase [Alphaproteobacteria bacterium]MBU2307861.1 M20/M25/M40 family metallo-hydrolase [Alphaproteobacteria bacterium]